MSGRVCRGFLRALKRQPVTSSIITCAACKPDFAPPSGQTRASSSNSRWKMRQGRDIFAREAKVQGLKSRAAFKLLEMDAKYRIFRKGQTVVDLGYAPGSWSQVAADRTKPHGQVLGIDIIPAQPPKGVSTIQGNFLSPDVQNMVKDHLVRAKKRHTAQSPAPTSEGQENSEDDIDDTEPADIEDKPSYIDMERAASDAPRVTEGAAAGAKTKDGRLVDIVLSDMMMNTSGMAFRDHAGSMDLCSAALQFASDTLKNGGHFICKFYQGAEDKAFEKKLRTLFAKVHREKPESSRSDSKEAYFVALRRKGDVQM